MTIRLATQDDADAIARLWEALVEYHRGIDEDLPSAAPKGGMLYAQRLTNRLYDTHTRVLVAEVDGQVIG
ncbi:MAG TPA: hypothetical protein VHL11_11060, partial [Phototrophicaceae bacterium]|nr:hypothetical protein [Phototrophicaceae bacterium]